MNPNQLVSVPHHVLSQLKHELDRLKLRNSQLEPVGELIAVIRGIQVQTNGGGGVMWVDPSWRVEELLREAESAWRKEVGPLFDEHDSALRDPLWQQQSPAGMLDLAQARLEIIVAKTPEQTESDDRTFLRALIEKLIPLVHAEQGPQNQGA